MEGRPILRLRFSQPVDDGIELDDRPRPPVRDQQRTGPRARRKTVYYVQR